MNKFFKRLALLLAVLMIVSMMPVQLFPTTASQAKSRAMAQRRTRLLLHMN